MAWGFSRLCQRDLCFGHVFVGLISLAGNRDYQFRWPPSVTTSFHLFTPPHEKESTSAYNFAGCAAKHYSALIHQLVRCGINGIGSQPTRLSTLVNCRNRLTPSLPNSYFGNATFPTVTRTCSFDDIVRKPLCCAVEKVREAIEKMNDEYVRSALDYIESVEDMDLFRDVFYNSGGKGREPNLYVVGWMNFSYLETDFGWGKPVCLLPGDINFDGKAFLLDSADGDGFVVAVCLQASLVDDLKKLFCENIQDPTSKL
ncbi:hypothetical protein Fmac_029447 [Flemingia macrophylla]|uniref:Uncharacterized protein n=1 Tax=Flemingia macrophylla TaxID=520843 RepID=A0ABD1LAW9_9FABA